METDPSPQNVTMAVPATGTRIRWFTAVKNDIVCCHTVFRGKSLQKVVDDCGKRLNEPSCDKAVPVRNAIYIQAPVWPDRRGSVWNFTLWHAVSTTDSVLCLQNLQTGDYLHTVITIEALIHHLEGWLLRHFRVRFCDHCCINPTFERIYSWGNRPIGSQFVLGLQNGKTRSFRRLIAMLIFVCFVCLMPGLASSYRLPWSCSVRR